jgi:hypothetical protein
MAGLLASARELICDDLIATHNGLVAAVQARREYARSWTKFGKAINTMAYGQLPPLASEFEKLSDLFNEVAEIHATLSDVEDRNADDFRDIYERFDVLYRQSHVNSEAKAEFMSAFAAYEAIKKQVQVEREKPTWAKVELKFLQQEAGAKGMLRAARDRYRGTLQELVRVREAYTAFKIRRLRSGFLLYVRALRQASEKELDVFARIQELLSGLSLSGEAAAALDAQLVAAPPEAVAPEAIVAVIEAAEAPLQEEALAEESPF